LSISHCSICYKLFQKHEISEDLNQSFPSEVKQLKILNGSLKKCPLCGTFYHYVEYDFCPDPFEIPVRTYKRLTRCSYFHVKDLLLDPNVEEANKETFLKEWEEIEKVLYEDRLRSKSHRNIKL